MYIHINKELKNWVHDLKMTAKSQNMSSIDINVDGFLFVVCDTIFKLIKFEPLTLNTIII